MDCSVLKLASFVECLIFRYCIELSYYLNFFMQNCVTERLLLQQILPKLQQRRFLSFPVVVHPSPYTKFVISGNNMPTMTYSSSTHHLQQQQIHEASSNMSVAAVNGEQKAGIVEQTIREKLMQSLSPITHLTILNESHRHNVPVNSETHFKVVIVASKFETIPTLVGRHRLVNTILADELSGPIHALSIVAKAPAQWSDNMINIEPSPACRGGDGSLPPREEKSIS